MAEPVPLPAAPPSSGQTGGVVVPVDPMEEEFSKGLREELLQDFIPNYTPRLAITNNVDKLNDRYEINTKAPLPHLDTATAKAYEVNDNASEAEEKHYALVCDRTLPVRTELAKQLLALENQENKEETSLIKLYAEGIVRISAIGEERQVFIFEQPQGKTLEEIINSQPQTFPDRYVREKIVTPLSSALELLEKLGASHGKINPKNIYIQGNRLVLGECLSEPCGYSQDFHYEPVNYIQAHPAGKGGGQGALDYYALGVIIAYMKLKPKSLQVTNKEVFIRRLLQEGSYIGIVGYIDLSDEMNDVLRGTLNDNPQERWFSEQLNPWCDGKRYNLLTPSIPTLGGRPFELENQSFVNLRQLANGVRHFWDKSISVLQDNSLGRWVELSTRRREISEYIAKVVKGYRNITPENIGEVIGRSLFALDPIAPIHLQHVSVHPDGANILLADLYNKKETKALAELKLAIKNSLFSTWQEAQRSVFNIPKLETHIQQGVWALDRARLNINNENLGFGIERTLYELNPELTCQSDIIRAHHVSNLTDLLVALDHVAKSESKPLAPLDRHIASFISTKLPLNNLITFSEYAQYPDLANHKGLLALKFLQKAQQNSKNVKVPGLAAWIVASITDVIGAFHSHTLRKELCEQLSNMAKEGDLGPILDYITSYDYSTADAQAFTQATEQYAEFSSKISGLQDANLLEFRAFKIGNTIAKSIALTIFIAICFFYFGGD